MDDSCVKGFENRDFFGGYFFREGDDGFVVFDGVNEGKVNIIKELRVNFYYGKYLFRVLIYVLLFVGLIRVLLGLIWLFFFVFLIMCKVMWFFILFFVLNSFVLVYILYLMLYDWGILLRWIRGVLLMSLVVDWIVVVMCLVCGIFDDDELVMVVILFVNLFVERG